MIVYTCDKCGIAIEGQPQDTIYVNRDHICLSVTYWEGTKCKHLCEACIREILTKGKWTAKGLKL